MDALLEIEGLQLAHGQRQVLRGLDLTVYRGEILGVIGRNGAGKSTLVNIICGRLQAQGGVVTLDGEPFRPESREAALVAGVSVIEQDFQPPTELTVAQAIFRDTFMADRPLLELVEHGRRIADRARVQIDLEAFVGELDAAQQAMVEVLRVVAEEAQLVILDEASVALNDAEIAQLHYAARKLRQMGCSIIYIAHRIDEVHAIADRVVVLRGGIASEIIEPRRAKVDDLVYAMLHHPVERPKRRASLAQTQPLFSVRGLRAEGLESLDLDIGAGEVVGVVGMRRSGAAETLQVLGGDRAGQVDEITIAGRTYTSLDEALPAIAVLGIRSQSEGVISDALAAASKEESEIGRLRDAATLAHHLQLATSNIQAPVGTLSGGDRQKVSVAAAGAVEQPVIVLHQPTRGVDIGAKQRVHDVVDRFLAEGKAILVTSNDVSEILALAHRVIVFFQGALVVDVNNADANEDLLMAYAETGESGEPVYIRANRQE